MDASGLSADEAILLARIPGSILYGAFVVMFFATLYVLIKKRKTAQPNWVLIGVACSMFSLATFIEGLSWSRIRDAFIVYRDTLTPLGYFAEISNWKFVLRTTLLCVYLLCADFALVYRCWIVWSRRFIVVAFPICLFVADIAMVIGIAIIMSQNTGTTVFAEAIIHWTTALISLTLGQNLIVTTLIVYRILQAHKAGAQYRSGGNANLIAIALIIESGALYVTGLFVFLVTYVTQSNAVYIMFDCMNGIIGLAFTMMIVRIGLGLTPVSSASPSDNSYSIPPLAVSSYPMQPSMPRRAIAVAVNRSVDVDDNDANSEFDGQKHSAGEKDGDSSV